MTKFNYLKISKYKKIRYLTNKYRKKPYLVFLHGFMSDLEGKKPKTLNSYAKKKKIGFLAPEYSGHGLSSGKFTSGNISIWSKETSVLIKKIIKKKNFILIGSSMGSWIALNQFKFFNKQIKGLVGIGSAPEFLQNLIWKKLTNKMKKKLLKKKIVHLKHGGYEYPITYQLIKDGKKNKILHKRINSKIKITMIHGEKDEVVPIENSKKLLKIFTNAKKKLVIIKKGNHSLSNKQNLKRIKKELDYLLSEKFF